MFIIEKTMPNGALGKYHKVVKLELDENSTDAIVNSYASPDMKMISWQDTYVIPNIYKVESLQDVESLLILPGAPFEGATLVPAGTDEDIQVKKANLKAKAKEVRNKCEGGGVETEFGVLDSDPDSQRKLLGAIVTADPTATVQWRMKDNSIVTLTYEQLKTIGTQLMQHIENCQVQKNTFDAQIDAANTEEELNNIVIS